MRGAPTRGGRRRSTITPAGILLILVGFVALTMIVLSPAVAEARPLDGAGTASLEDSPVDPVPYSAPEAGATSSATTGGGIGVPGLPSIKAIRCVNQCVSATRAPRGAAIRIVGENLNRVRRIVFKGREGRIRTGYKARRPNALRVIVPKGAVRGYVFVVDGSGNRSNRSPSELPVLPKTAIPVELFPIRGAFSFGSSGSRFGSGRAGHTHQGQDVSAKCGTTLVAVKRARVQYNRWDGGAGNYVVLKNMADNTSFVYMHMIRRSPLKVGRVVNAGTPVGRVGNTGRSYGCHLHFEYWIGPWQTGGRPIDPLPYLRSLAKKR